MKDRRTHDLRLSSDRRYRISIDGKPVCGFAIENGEIKVVKLPLPPLTCTVPSCSKPSHGRLCGAHRQRLLDFGDVLAHIPVGKRGQTFQRRRDVSGDPDEWKP